MYNLEKADKIFEAKMRENDRFAENFIKKFRNLMPEIYARTMFEEVFGFHIYDEAMYNEAVSYLKWADGKGKGARWDVDTLIKLSGIDFEQVDFFEYDFAYVVNMLWSDYCEIFTETTNYLKMAEIYLTDPDYPGKADERAYHDAVRRIKYNERFKI